MNRRVRNRFIRSPRGGFRVHLAADEKVLLATLPDQMREVLLSIEMGESHADEIGRRIFPPAYPLDQDAETAFAATTRSELMAHHQQALDLLARTAQATNVSDEELEGWLTAINDIRLVLGNSLGVTEQDNELTADDPNYAEKLCYHYLTYLEGEIVDALASYLPPPRVSDSEPLPDDPWGEAPGGLRWDGTDRPSEQ